MYICEGVHYIAYTYYNIRVCTTIPLGSLRRFIKFHHVRFHLMSFGLYRIRWHCIFQFELPQITPIAHTLQCAPHESNQLTNWKIYRTIKLSLRVCLFGCDGGGFRFKIASIFVFICTYSYIFLSILAELAKANITWQKWTEKVPLNTLHQRYVTFTGTYLYPFY